VPRQAVSRVGADPSRMTLRFNVLHLRLGPSSPAETSAQPLPPDLEIVRVPKHNRTGYIPNVYSYC
jgi:hypothetical protein